MLATVTYCDLVEVIQLFQLTLSDQSFKPRRQDRMVVRVEVEGCSTCRILMRYDKFVRFFFLIQTNGKQYLSHNELKRNFPDLNYVTVNACYEKMSHESNYIYLIPGLNAQNKIL